MQCTIRFVVSAREMGERDRTRNRGREKKEIKIKKIYT
jgi:hypothetical protein